MNLDNDTITGLLGIINDQRNQLKLQEDRLSDTYADLENTQQLLDYCLGAMQGYQKSGGAGRAEMSEEKYWHPKSTEDGGLDWLCDHLGDAQDVMVQMWRRLCELDDTLPPEGWPLDDD